MMLTVRLESPLRLVVADRQEVARSGIRSAVERAGLVVAAECGDGASATAAVVRERAEICVIDAELPGMGDAVAAVVSLPLAPKVVVIGTAPHVDALFAALELGASGYLLADMEPSRLADELWGVSQGGLALAPALAARLIEERRPAAAASLTDREWKALELFAAGLTTQEIALRLRVSSTRARRHISSAVKRIAAAHWTRSGQRSELKARIWTRTEEGAA